jgi:hypothetical protein
MGAVGALVVGAIGLVVIAAQPDGRSFPAMVWPVVLGTAVGLGGGVAAYVWSANQHQQGKLQSTKARNVTLGSVLTIAGVAAILRGGPIALQAGILSACVVWFATLMSLAAIWIARLKSSWWHK